jgi:hypothetical protein
MILFCIFVTPDDSAGEAETRLVAPVGIFAPKDYWTKPSEILTAQSARDNTLIPGVLCARAPPNAGPQVSAFLPSAVANGAHSQALVILVTPVTR